MADLQRVQHTAGSSRYMGTDVNVCLSHGVQLLLEERLDTKRRPDSVELSAHVIPAGAGLPTCRVCDLDRGSLRVDPISSVLDEIHRYSD